MTIDEQRGRVIAMDVHQDSTIYVYDLPDKVKKYMKWFQFKNTGGCATRTSTFFITFQSKQQWKKREAKAQKPSEMGLHSKTRYVIHLQGKDRTEQMRDLILRAVDLFDRVQPVFCPEEPCMTRKFARHVSLTVTFVGFSDDEVFKIVAREAVRQRRILR